MLLETSMLKFQVFETSSYVENRNYVILFEIFDQANLTAIQLRT